MSDKTQHTPGPWDYWPQVAYPQGVITDGKGRHVAVPTLITLEKAAANGRLIAAAPDLLAVVEEAIERYGKPGGPWNVPSDPGGWIARAQAAVAKARGGER